MGLEKVLRARKEQDDAEGVGTQQMEVPLPVAL